jgi:hypothetical protein
MSGARKDKKFFFEKKNQKTFAPLRAVVNQPGTKLVKFFCFFLFTKRSASFLYGDTI